MSSIAGELAADDAVMECRICWHQYDPRQGDPVWQVPPGTPFARLPEQWRCPECDADRTQFLRVDGDGGE
jgi:rubredoxin